VSKGSRKQKAESRKQETGIRCQDFYYKNNYILSFKVKPKMKECSLFIILAN